MIRLALLSALLCPLCLRAEGAPVDLAEVLTRIESALNATRSATYRVDSWQKQGSKVEHSQFETWWAGPDRIRVEVVGGDNRSSVAVLQGDQVVAWRKGLLGFIKLTLDRHGKMATSVRGNDIGKAGYFDEWRELLARRDTAELELVDGLWVVRYVDGNGLDTTLWMQPEPLRVLRQEVVEGDELVERYRFGSVSNNPELDPALFQP